MSASVSPSSAAGTAGAGAMAADVSIERTAEIVARGRRVLSMERDALEAASIALGDEFVRAVRLDRRVHRSRDRGRGRQVRARRAQDRRDPHLHRHAGDVPAPRRGRARRPRHRGTARRGDPALQEWRDRRSCSALIDALSRLGVRIIAMTVGAHLARSRATPTWCSTSACAKKRVRTIWRPPPAPPSTLALGDALAVALLQERGFGAEDFARLHPGGSLGRRLLTRVRDVMVSEPLPTVPAGATHARGHGVSCRPSRHRDRRRRATACWV